MARDLSIVRSYDPHVATGIGPPWATGTRLDVSVRLVRQSPPFVPQAGHGAARVHTVRLGRVTDPETCPRRPKAIAATSPGAPSSIRTVTGCQRHQPRHSMKRRSEVHETSQPRSARNSWTYVDLRAVGRQPALDLLHPGREQRLARHLHPPWSRHAQRRESGELLPTRLGTVACEADRLSRLDASRPNNSSSDKRVRRGGLRPAVGGEDGAVEGGVAVGEPGRAGVVEVGEGALAQLALGVLVDGSRLATASADECK